jgi:hypothetical protein
MRIVRGDLSVRSALVDGARALVRPAILVLQLAAIAAVAGLQTVWVAAGGAGGGADDPKRAILAATLFAVPIRALVSGITVRLILDRAATVPDALRGAMSRYPTLVGAVATASLLVTPPGWLVEAFDLDLGWAGWVLSAVTWWAGVKLVFVPVVAAVEAGSLGATIVAAWRLTDGRWWRTLVLGALTASILGILSGTLAGAGGVTLPTTTWFAVSIGSLSAIDVFYAAAYRRLLDGPAPDATVASAAEAAAT